MGLISHFTKKGREEKRLQSLSEEKKKEIDKRIVPTIKTILSLEKDKKGLIKDRLGLQRKEIALRKKSIEKRDFSKNAQKTIDSIVKSVRKLDRQIEKVNTRLKLEQEELTLIEKEYGITISNYLSHSPYFKKLKRLIRKNKKREEDANISASEETSLELQLFGGRN